MNLLNIKSVCVEVLVYVLTFPATQVFKLKGWNNYVYVRNMHFCTDKGLIILGTEFGRIVLKEIIRGLKNSTRPLANIIIILVEIEDKECLSCFNASR